MTPEQMTELERLAKAAQASMDWSIAKWSRMLFLDFSVPLKQYLGEVGPVAVLDLIAAAREAGRLKSLINDFGYDCLPECDSVAHAEKCPHVNFAEAYERTASENAKLRDQLRLARDFILKLGFPERDVVQLLGEIQP